VTGGAHRWVLAAQRSRIEAGTVRVESPAADSRVAGQAVALGMAGDAALQILACRLTVIEQEGLLGVVIAPVSKPGGRDEAGVQVAVGAELPLVVAVAAGALTAVGRRRVSGEEAHWVVARCRGSRVRPVAGQTGWTGVAGAATLGTGRGRLGVHLGKVEPVRGGPLPADRCSRPAPGAGRVDRLHIGRRSDVTGDAALLGMAHRAFRGLFACLAPVAAEEARVGVIRRRFQLRLEREGPWVRAQRLDRRNLGRVHVALGAVVAGMAGRARGGNGRSLRPRQLAVTRGGKCGTSMR